MGLSFARRGWKVGKGNISFWYDNWNPSFNYLSMVEMESDLDMLGDFGVMGSEIF